MFDHENADQMIAKHILGDPLRFASQREQDPLLHLDKGSKAARPNQWLSDLSNLLPGCIHSSQLVWNHLPIAVHANSRFQGSNNVCIGMLGWHYHVLNSDMRDMRCTQYFHLLLFTFRHWKYFLSWQGSSGTDCAEPPC